MTYQFNAPSYLYQHKFSELQIGDEILATLPDTSDKYCDELLELREKIMERLLAVMEQHLTEHQYRVMMMHFIENMTQTAIAEAINIHQSSVHKAIYGNVVYYPERKVYGGAVHKLKRICEADEILNGLFAELAQLKEDLLIAK